MNISPIFKDKKLGTLEAKWAHVFDPTDEDAEDCEDYSELMVETFPILYKAWTDPSGMVSREFAALLGAFCRIFMRYSDDEGNFLGNGVYRIAAFFHEDFINAFIFQNEDYSFRLSEDGIIQLESENFIWEVNSKTFELSDAMTLKY